MRTATITTTSGHTWTTDINGTDREILDYFMLVPFDISPNPEVEKFDTVKIVTIDGKTYSASWRAYRYAKEFRLYSRPIRQTQTQSADTWFLDVLDSDDSLTTIGIPNDRESGVSMYRTFCPTQSTPLQVL